MVHLLNINMDDAGRRELCQMLVIVNGMQGDPQDLCLECDGDLYIVLAFSEKIRTC